MAEVASAFHEQLLAEYLIQEASINSCAWLINRQSTRCAPPSFGRRCSRNSNSGFTRPPNAGPLGIARFAESTVNCSSRTEIYHDALELECLRIPILPRFYVYKYATGMSAAIAWRRVTTGWAEQLDYFKMLEGGCSARRWNSSAEPGRYARSDRYR